MNYQNEKIMQLHGYKDTDLIPELQEWKSHNGENFGIIEWMQCNITPQHFIALSSIFNPDFTEYQGGVFYTEAIEQVKESIKHNGYSSQTLLRLQRIYNHEHLLDLFANPEGITKIQLEYIGKILVNLWHLILKSKFPHLNIHCELTGLDSKDMSDIIVTFWAD